MINIFKESLSSYLGGGRGGDGVKKRRFSPLLAYVCWVLGVLCACIVCTSWLISGHSNGRIRRIVTTMHVPVAQQGSFLEEDFYFSPRYSKVLTPFLSFR